MPGALLAGGLLQGGVQGSPVLRLLLRWVRRPLLPVIRLWRRNIQLKVIVTTLLMSLGVVLLLGFVVIGQVRNGLLDAKVSAAQSQAAGGFAAAKTRADEEAGKASGTGAAEMPGEGEVAGSGPIPWTTDLLESLSSGGQGAYDVVILPVADTFGSPRSSGTVEPEASIPEALSQRLEDSSAAAQSYTRVVYKEARPSQPALVIGKQIIDPEGEPYQLYFLFPLTQEEKSLSLVKGTLATAGVFLVGLLGAIAWLVVRQVVTPVRMAAGVAERLSAGRLQERMKVTGEDDIARLGEAFNKMAQNLQLKIQQLEDLSRMQRRFVSDVSHELRTPLTTVRMAADVIHEARGDFDPVTARSAELLTDQLDRFESLLADLLEISRFDAGAAALEAEPTDLRDVVRRVVGGAEPLAERKGTRIRVVGDRQPVIAEVDARRVERVLRNLVVNAVEHGEGKDVVVRLASAGGAVAVAVRDYGVGLKPGEATRVFSRFWRADPARARTTGGTGLGLSIALEDARLHGGWLQAWGEPGGGSQFRLTLPRTADEPLRGSPIPLEPRDSRQSRRAREAARAQQPVAVDGVTSSSAHGGGRAAVPVQPVGDRLPPRGTPVARRPGPAADPAALPGDSARVVSRPSVPVQPTAGRSSSAEGRSSVTEGRSSSAVTEDGVDGRADHRQAKDRQAKDTRGNGGQGNDGPSAGANVARGTAADAVDVAEAAEGAGHRSADRGADTAGPDRWGSRPGAPAEQEEATRGG
ncbi:MtrAB system histidine kinase MtrB [Streptomyces fragilis]|uniref:Sensor histidine kinase MtrB n=1 Tax=Streptomyces fragilis TaxID=67301 RepID=A0ABV2YDW5_9ACTN|nr:MtrAB system histidine kinase MtrB [Streptomyces fragilis]